MRLHTSVTPYRVALGTADGSAPHAYKLTRSRVSSNGIVIGHYERDGEIKIGDTALDSPSKLEIARQERMKREG